MSSTICASCTGLSIDKPVKSSPAKKPQWLDDRDHVSEFIATYPDCKLKKQTQYTQQFDVEVGRAHQGKHLLYWAAQSCSALKANDAKTAYGSFRNHGVSKVDSKGNVRVYLQCPQPYKTKKKGETTPTTFYRHFHYVLSNSEKTSWTTQIYTKMVSCELNYNDLIDTIRKGTAVVLNVLPPEYYGKDHIPNTYNLPVKTVQRMKVDESKVWLSDVIGRHYPVLHKALQSKTITLKEVPIVCYCAHKDCNASELASIALMKKGFVRVDEYKGGMKEYNNKTKN
jgi:rhodanese-related sulfurtransferase